MIQEAIEKIEALVNANNTEPLTEAHQFSTPAGVVELKFKVVEGANGHRSLGDMITPPRPAKIGVTTLTGLVDAVKSGTTGFSFQPAPGSTDLAASEFFENQCIVHVESPTKVQVASALCDKYGKRDVYIEAIHTPLNTFKFDEYMMAEKFIIGLQMAFVPTEEVLKLIKLASNMKAENGISTSDDGLSQTIGVKRGEVKVDNITLPTRIPLAPYRTFYEANPVMSDFLPRLKQDAQGVPHIGLFDVTGNKWVGETMLSIKKYLVEALGDGVTVLA